MTVAERERLMVHRGGVLQLRLDLEAIQETTKVLEFVVEGPRGTGKSNGVAYLAWKLCHAFQNVRILVIRTSRSLLTDTFCKTYEEDVCPGHASISKAQRTQRHEYFFPESRSRIVLGGLDDCQRYYGSDWDVVIVEEAVQFVWKDIEPFLGAMRNAKLPFHALIYATNPDAPKNWVNRRAIDGHAKRFKCTHYDNPSLWDRAKRCWTTKGRVFMDSLSRYTGVAKSRHVDGEWKGAEGMVWDNWDEEMHIVPFQPDRAFAIKGYRASVDWGYAEPGSMSIWGVDGDKRLIRVAHCYHTKKNLDWWAQWAVTFMDQYHMTSMVCDPSRPDAIDTFNDWLVKAGHPRIAYGADNTRRSTTGGDLAGLDLVRWGLGCDVVADVKVPRIRIIKDSLRHIPDPDLVSSGKPWSGEQEVASYVYKRDATDEEIADKTDPSCADHFCDEMRYEASDNWRRVTQEYKPPEWIPPVGTYAHKYGTPESLLRERAKRNEGLDGD